MSEMSDRDRRDPAHPDRRKLLPRGGRRQTDKVPCPFCASFQTAVAPLKPTVDDQRADGYVRRRQCQTCGRIFRTVETVMIDSRA